MAPDPTIYCLENVTDYFQFERLCHDLMALEGYSQIEPLGNFKDKGRDAIHVDRTSGKTSIFAYSVREDWRDKLDEDAGKVAKHGHCCDDLVFITTEHFTATERDDAVGAIQERFDWKLELYGVERLRVLLDAAHPGVKKNHPQIFPPSFQHKGRSATSSRDHLFLCHTDTDRPLAEWLARKLTATGYAVWCRSFSLLGGDSYPEHVEMAIKDATFRFLLLHSRDSVRDANCEAERTLALGIGRERDEPFVIPLTADDVDVEQSNWLMRDVTTIAFQNSWADGLRQLIDTLQKSGCPTPVEGGQGVAANTFLEDDVVRAEQTEILSNCLLVLKVPEGIQRFKRGTDVTPKQLGELKGEWACRQIEDGRFLSFHSPPDQWKADLRMANDGGVAWRHTDEVHGIEPMALVSELIRKSLLMHAKERGLRFCLASTRWYFPDGLFEKNWLKYTRPDGSAGRLQVVGRRKFWSPRTAEHYRHFLSPVLRVRQDLGHEFVIMVRSQLRLTDDKGKALPSTKFNSRRKHLCKNWWNDDWMNRLLAICSFLSDDDVISIGRNEDELLLIQGYPSSGAVPVGVDEEALDRLQIERARMLRHGDEGSSEESSEAD